MFIREIKSIYYLFQINLIQAQVLKTLKEIYSDMDEPVLHYLNPN